VNKLTGIRISQHADLYDIDFSYCKSVIDDAEKFLIAVEKNLKLIPMRTAARATPRHASRGAED
jgi:hypothetical protein